MVAGLQPDPSTRAREPSSTNDSRRRADDVSAPGKASGFGERLSKRPPDLRPAMPYVNHKGASRAAAIAQDHSVGTLQARGNRRVTIPGDKKSPHHPRKSVDLVYYKVIDKKLEHELTEHGNVTTCAMATWYYIPVCSLRQVGANSRSGHGRLRRDRILVGTKSFRGFMKESMPFGSILQHY